MSEPTREELDALARIVGEPEWNDECDVWGFSGAVDSEWFAYTIEESADGIPAWRIRRRSSGYTIEREIGWCVHTAEAPSGEAEELVNVCRALDAAHAAFERVLSEDGT